MDITVTTTAREDVAVAWATDVDNAERTKAGQSPRTPAQFLADRFRLELAAYVREYDATHKVLVGDKFVAADDVTRASVLTTLKDVALPLPDAGL